jgi:hypothetical protein
MKRSNQILSGSILLSLLIILISCGGGSETSAPQPLKIMTERLPSASYGQEYYCVLAGSGGYQPYKWEMVGKIPKGIKFNSADGSFRGRPGPDAETSTFDIKLFDSIDKENQAPISRRFTLTILSGPFIASEKDLLPLRILTATLTDGEVNSTYSAYIAATGGMPPCKWQITGTLPKGIAFDQSTGQLSGIPAVNGKWKLSFKVTDLLGKKTDVASPLEFNIKPKALLRGEGFPPLRIISNNLPAAVTGKSYSGFLSATGGISPYLWRIESPLPDGLEFDPESGEISGTPSIPGIFNLSFSAKDSKSLTTSAKTTIRFEVMPPAVNRAFPLRMLTSELPSAETDRDYSVALSAQGGVMPYRWTSLTPMPPGLTLKNETGVISGIPAETGSYTIKMELSDSKIPPSASWRTFKLEIGEGSGSYGWLLWFLLVASLGFGGYILKIYLDLKKKHKTAGAAGLQILTDTLPKAREGDMYASPILLKGGKSPYYFETIGVLPAGFEIERESGIITGKPPYAHPGNYEVKIKVSDGNLPPKETSVILTIEILPGMIEVSKKTITLLAKDGKIFFEAFPPGSGEKKLLNIEDLQNDENEFMRLIADITKENNQRKAFYVIYCQTAHPSGIEISFKAAQLARKAGIQFYSILKDPNSNG